MLISTRSPGLKVISCADKLIKAISVTFGAPPLSGSEYVHEIHNFLRLMHGQYRIMGPYPKTCQLYFRRRYILQLLLLVEYWFQGRMEPSSGNVQRQSLDLHYKQVEYQSVGEQVSPV